MIEKLRKLSLCIGINLDYLIRYASSEEFMYGDRVRILRDSDSHMIDRIGEVNFVDTTTREVELNVNGYGHWSSFDDIELIDRRMDREEVKWDIYNYSTDQLLRFIKSIIPTFPELDDNKVKFVEQALVRLNGVSYEAWRDSVGAFLKAYPEYINIGLLGDSIFNIIYNALDYGDMEFLKIFPESILFELWENNKDYGLENLHGLSSIIYNKRELAKFMKIYPNFGQMLIFNLASEHPFLYLYSGLDKLYGDIIDKEDVVETLFKQSYASFLDWEGSKDYPVMERRAVYRLIFDARSGQTELSRYFDMDRQYYVKYSEWLKEAIEKFINKGYSIQEMSESFFTTDLGKYMLDRIAYKLTSDGDFDKFFLEGIHYYSPDLGYKAAQKLLDSKNLDMIYRVFENYQLLEVYPGLSDKYEEVMSGYGYGEHAMEFEESSSWEEDYEDETPPPADENETSSSVAEKDKSWEEDPDEMEYFERGQ